MGVYPCVKITSDITRGGLGEIMCVMQGMCQDTCRNWVPYTSKEVSVNRNLSPMQVLDRVRLTGLDRQPNR